MKTHSSTTIAPPVVAALRSPRWTSQVQRCLERMTLSSRVHWQPDFESAQKIALSQRDTVLIAELPAAFSSKPLPFLKSILPLCNNSQQCCLFLLGDDSADPWQGLLREAGATDVCTSMLDFENMWLKVERHLKNSLIDDLTVEQTVAARLPW